MADFINFDQICLDLQTGVQQAPSQLGFANVFVDANDRDYVFQNFPLLDIRVKRMDPQQITNQTYYSDVTLEAEIVAQSMTNRAEAAKLRYDLLNALCRYLKDNPRFSGLVDDTAIGQANFVTAESKTDGAFVAGVVLEFHPKIYTE
jgi:hypothetical protein